MAKIQSQNITVELQKLVKDSETDSAEFLNPEFKESLEEVVQELVNDDKVLVEVKFNSESDDE